MSSQQVLGHVHENISRLRRHIGTLERTLDFCRAGGHIFSVLCSPLDQPKGLRRGFAFRGGQCR
jgi:hypothetical protein